LAGFVGFVVAVDDSPDVAATGVGSVDPTSGFDEPASESGDPASDEPSSPLRDAELALIAARRSFFAQPEPL